MEAEKGNIINKKTLDFGNIGETVEKVDEVLLKDLPPEVIHIYNELSLLQDDHFLIVHQTNNATADKIAITGMDYFSNTGLDGTSLISNPYDIAMMSSVQEEGNSKGKYQIHKGANALVILAIKKDNFPPNTHRLSDIDYEIGDLIDGGYLNKFGLPFDSIYGYTFQNQILKNPAWSGNIRKHN